MIRLTKGPQPACLASNAVAWTEELLACRATGQPPPPEIVRRYAQAEIKDAVISESHGKCIYCESKILHISYGELEHIRPKSRYPQLTYNWSNLALVCSRCNNAKRDRFEEPVPPIDPFTEEPRDFLVAHGEWLRHLPGNDRGRETIALADLNRPQLTMERRKRVEQIAALADAHAHCASDAARAALLAQIREELADDGEYALVARSTALVLGVSTA